MPKADDANWGRYAGLGLETAVAVALGLAAGWWLDGKFGWAPWATLVGAILGLAAGMYALIKQAVRLNRD